MCEETFQREVNKVLRDTCGCDFDGDEGTMIVHL